MSVVVKDQQTGEIVLLSKGADSVMEKLLKKGDQAHDRRLNITKTYLDDYATEGLRTLMLTKRVLSAYEYGIWNTKVTQAALSTVDREDKIDAANAEIEVELTLVGSTAIEDRLQDEVAETIISLKDAGIKLWVLTGDKVETAVNIGYSAGLLNNEMEQFYIDGVTIGEISHQCADMVDKMHNSSFDDGTIKRALIAAGDSLTKIEGNAGLLSLFLSLTDQMDVVLGCRVSPKQKADIVGMIKDRFPDKITLSIGDGANDCPMINRAHVGIGIAGKEGMQAARCSDFAIGKFMFLRPLLFVHGREAYRRNADLIMYMFYKNILYVIAVFMYGGLSVFSGQTLYEKWLYQLYNVTFTSFPIIVYALYDYEYPTAKLMYTPEFFKLGIFNLKYDVTTILVWVIYACWQAALILCLSMVLPTMSGMENGKSFDFWNGGSHVYMMTIIFANLSVLRLQNCFNGFNEVLMFGHISFYILCLYLWSRFMHDSPLYEFWPEFLMSKSAWLGNFLLICSLWTVDPMLIYIKDFLLSILQCCCGAR